MGLGLYHISKDGTPAVCHARRGHCPLGGPSVHFSSIIEAQKYADKKNSDNYSNNKSTLNKKILNNNTQNPEINMQHRSKVKRKELDKKHIDKEDYYNRIEEISYYKEDMGKIKLSEHFVRFRRRRRTLLAKKLPEGVVVNRFLLKVKDSKTYEIHEIYSNGEDRIYSADGNPRTLITKFAPRYSRLQSIYDKMGIKMTKKLKNQVIKNTKEKLYQIH